MNLDDFKAIDFKDIGHWPPPVKIFSIALLALFTLAVGIWFDTLAQREALHEVIQKEEAIRITFELKQRKAANLQAYKNQLEEMQRSFGAMLRQLPGKTEVAALLFDISRAGVTNGLLFEKFKPKKEKPAEFYAELPIEIEVTGEYHNFGRFVSDVAALSRIVTLHDINIISLGGEKGFLQLSAVAKTYRYLETDEK